MSLFRGGADGEADIDLLFSITFVSMQTLILLCIVCSSLPVMILIEGRVKVSDVFSSHACVGRRDMVGDEGTSMGKEIFSGE